MMTTTKLKLWRDETEPEASGEARTLRFPAEAVSAMPAPSRPSRAGGVAGRVVRPSISHRPGAASSDDLVRHIERTLDRVQEKFDDLKGQISQGYRISPEDPDDWPRPSAA